MKLTPFFDVVSTQKLFKQGCGMVQLSQIDGFDPLATSMEGGEEFVSVVEEASKRIVYNILKSYTGYFDVFSELIQNALDAVQARGRTGEVGYKPRIWISIDVPSGLVQVTDNGIGMSNAEFRYCLRPNVSFKRQTELRGHKGVGATFLAYGFSFMRLQSRKQGSELAAILRQGRQWAEDSSGTVPRPKFEAVKFDAPLLEGQSSGTSVGIFVGKAPGERPKNLGWIGAQTAEQWSEILRIKSPLGGIYLSAGGAPNIDVLIEVNSAEGTRTTKEISRPDYYYPHEIPGLKIQTVSDVSKAIEKIDGDTTTKFAKVGQEYKRLDALWDIWDKSQILAEESPFSSALTEEAKTLIEKHNVVVYAVFLRSAKIWGEFNDDVLRLRKGQRLIHGGLQLASDFMPQGDLSIIPLTSTIGYQANTHVVVHFTDGNPDMGRKVFQPELTELGEQLAVRAVNVFKRYLTHLKPDTGAQVITPEKELYDWKREQEQYRDKNPLAFSTGHGSVALISKPRQEQDVIALFHEFIGMSLVRGYKFLGTSQSDRYDSLFLWDYDSVPKFAFSKDNRLGVSKELAAIGVSEPKVLEYKYSFDGLITDLDREEKFAKQIDLVVCWSVGRSYRERFYFEPLLVGDEGSSRSFFGSTHQAYLAGSHGQPLFEVIVLEDLVSWLQDPASEEARQKGKYRD